MIASLCLSLSFNHSSLYHPPPPSLPPFLSSAPPPSHLCLPLPPGSWFVTSVHATLSAKWFTTHGKHLAAGGGTGWFKSWQFRLGGFMYYTGLAATIYHDHLQRTLRPCPGGARYCIPHGGLFEYVTAGNYLAELWMWMGFAIMSWGPNGAFIFLVSLVNLTPRSAATHQWCGGRACVGLGVVGGGVVGMLVCTRVVFVCVCVVCVCDMRECVIRACTIHSVFAVYS